MQRMDEDKVESAYASFFLNLHAKSVYKSDPGKEKELANERSRAGFSYAMFTPPWPEEDYVDDEENSSDEEEDSSNDDEQPLIMAKKSIRKRVKASDPHQQL